MITKRSLLLLSAALAALGSSATAQDMVPLKTELPKPLFVGTPVPMKVPNLEPARQGKRPDFMVPAGTTNLAKDKTVTASDTEPRIPLQATSAPSGLRR